jgi:hypothetical protein
MTTLIFSGAATIDKIWPLLRAGIESALETSHEECTIDDIYEGIKLGRTIVLYVAEKQSYFGMVIGMYNFPRYKIARVLLGFGKNICKEKASWEIVEDWARQNGCKYIEAWVATESRAKLFSRFGFKKTYQIVRSVL